MLLIDGLCTLANVIIANPFKLVWFQRQLFFCEDVVTIAIQTKDGFYHDSVLTNMFLFPTIKVFKCLHQQEKYFFIDVPTWREEQKVVKAFL